MKKLSIGSWAYIFNQEKPTTDFHQVIHKLHDLGYDGVELGSFGAHPTPVSHPTRADRQKLKKEVADHGMNICWEFEPGFAFNKPSEIVRLVDAVRAKGNPNFGVLYDTCHAHICAAVGANQAGAKETLPGGAMELLDKLKGKITHVHLIDSDGSLNEHNTSTHNPFGTGKLEFDKLLPELMQCGVPNDWWCVDLCFWPNAWDVTADSKRFLDKLRQKYAA